MGSEGGACVGARLLTLTEPTIYRNGGDLQNGTVSFAPLASSALSAAAFTDPAVFFPSPGIKKKKTLIGYRIQPNTKTDCKHRLSD